MQGNQGADAGGDSASVLRISLDLVCERGGWSVMWIHRNVNGWPFYFKRCFIKLSRNCGASFTDGQNKHRGGGQSFGFVWCSSAVRAGLNSLCSCPLPCWLITPVLCLLPGLCWHSCLLDNMLKEINSPIPANHAAAQIRCWKQESRRGEWEVQFKCPSKCYSLIWQKSNPVTPGTVPRSWGRQNKSFSFGETN